MGLGDSFLKWMSKGSTRGIKSSRKIPPGKIGYPVTGLIGRSYLQRIIVCACYNIEQGAIHEASSAGRHNLIENIWQGDGAFSGLRDLLDGFFNVESMPQQGKAITQAIPFEHLFFMHEQNQGITLPKEMIRASFLAEFEPLVGGRLIPRLASEGGRVGTNIQVYFGSGVFVPEINEQPVGEAYFELWDEENCWRIDLILGGDRQGSVKNQSSQGPISTLGGYYRGQSVIYFTDIPTLAPVVTSQELGLPQDFLYAVGVLSGDQKQPALYRLNLSAHAKLQAGNAAHTPMAQQAPPPESQDFWSLIDDSNLGYHIQKFDPLEADDYEYRTSILERISKTLFPDLVRADLVVVPNSAYSRLRQTSESLSQVPHCELLGVIMPATWPSSLQIQSIVIHLNSQNGLVSNPLQLPDELIFINRNRQVKRHQQDSFETLGDLTSQAASISRDGYSLSTTRFADKKLEKNGMVARNSFRIDRKEAAYGKHQSLPADDYWLLSRDEFNCMGYIGLPVFPGEGPENGWSTKAPVTYGRKKRGKEPTETMLLDWLDHAIELEIDDRSQGGTRRIGYANWWRMAKSDNRLLEADPQLSALLSTQNFATTDQDVILSEAAGLHIPDWHETLSDGDIIRVGPLLLRYCFSGQVGETG